MHLLEKLQISFTEEKRNRKSSPNLDALGSPEHAVDMPSSCWDTTASVVTGQGELKKPNL